MSWMANRRAAYHPDGPFVAKRSANVGNIEFVFGGIYTAAQLREEANITQRLIQRLYDTHWMDMAPEGAEPGPLPVRPAEPEPSRLEALFGSNVYPSTIELTEAASIQLGDAVRRGFEMSERTVTQWNALPEAERDEFIGQAIEQLRSEEVAKAPPVENTDEVAVSYVSLGFGRYQRVNAAGEPFGPFEKKAVYEQSQLPLVQKG